MSLFISDALAQAAQTAPTPPNGLASFLPLILIFFIFYFLVIRPQQKKIKDQNEVIDSIGKKDIIVTGGGIIGQVTKDEGDILHVEISPENTIKVLRSTISGRYSKSEAKNDTKKERKK